jgi:hypothetical protein
MHAIKHLILVAALASLPFLSQNRVDPAAWGSNHVGKPMPEYVHGDECLFCHRNDIGTTWQKNAHGVTVRQREDAPELDAMLKAQPALASRASEIEYFLGSRNRVRFLKKDGYGKFATLSAQAVVGEPKQPSQPKLSTARLLGGDSLTWDREKFGASCAGCHSTGVDAKEKTFSAFGLDCYVCHGDVNLDHTKDTSLILLSKKRRSDAKVITSICAQCHLRETKSRSSGLPWPNNFVAGDNLFQDLVVDWAKADDEKMNGGDRHVWRNVRDVAVLGKETVTCLSCHQVHGNSSLKHRRVLRTEACSDCHRDEGYKDLKSFTVQSGLCEY